MSTLMEMNIFIQSAQTAEVRASHFRDYDTVTATWKSQWVLESGDDFMHVESKRPNERKCE